MTDCGRPVTRRLVCYLSGFDPQGPAHYHQLYASEGAKQAQVSGYELEVGKRRKAGEHVAWWEVQWHDRQGGAACETRYEFLRWDDIVRAHWPRSRAGLFRSTAFASWQMWRNGVMWQTWRSSWPMFVAIASPGLLLMLGALLLALLATLATHWASHDNLWAVVALCLVGLPAWAGGLLWGERRTHMAWLMRSLACLVRQGRGQTPQLDSRLDDLAAHVGRQVSGGHFDEVLLVGHSSGAMMAMSIASRALASLPDGVPPSVRFSLLTLGHCAPLLSAQPEAAWFRADLTRLVDSDALCWVDYGAPPDGCCFPLVDPSMWRGDKADAAHRPKLVNPRFAQLFSPTGYAGVRADKFRCHFQYLMATELPGDYDFFALTAGPFSLAARHAQVSSAIGFRLFQCWGGPPT